MKRADQSRQQEMKSGELKSVQMKGGARKCGSLDVTGLKGQVKSKTDKVKEPEKDR